MSEVASNIPNDLETCWMPFTANRAFKAAPLTRAYEAFLKTLEAGVFYRINGDIFAIAPPSVSETEHIDQIVDTLRKVPGLAI